jgi:beta-mannosidase
VVSWSSIDYYGRWKALQYYSKRAYAPVIASPYINGDGDISVKLISDRAEDFKGTLEAYIMGFDGKIIRHIDVECMIKADGSEDATTLSQTDMEGDTFLYVRLLEKGRLVSENTFLSRYPKTYSRTKAVIEIESVRTEDGLELILSTDRLARCLYLYTEDENDFFEDNYIDLIPGFERRITVKTDNDIEKFNTIIKYQTL